MIGLHTEALASNDEISGSSSSAEEREARVIHQVRTVTLVTPGESLSCRKRCPIAQHDDPFGIFATLASWVTRMTVIPAVSFSSRNSVMTSRLVLESRFPVGSSPSGSPARSPERERSPPAAVVLRKAGSGDGPADWPVRPATISQWRDDGVRRPRILWRKEAAVRRSPVPRCDLAG